MKATRLPSGDQRKPAPVRALVPAMASTVTVCCVAGS